jgi:signal transduction histidine kinase
MCKLVLRFECDDSDPFSPGQRLMVVPLAVLLFADSDEVAEPIVRELERVGFRPEALRVTTADDLKMQLSVRKWQLVVAEETVKNVAGRQALELVNEMAPGLARVLVVEQLDGERTAAFSRPEMPQLLPKNMLHLAGPTVARALDGGELQQRLMDRDAELRRTRRLDSIGSLAGAMAHDLNNLLTPILIAAELLSEDAEEGANKPLCDGLLTSSRRAADLVKNLQSFIWGRSPEFREVRPQDILDELQQLMQFTLPRTITRQVDLAPDLQPILGEPSQLVQVLMSLIANAREAMPDGGDLTVRGENVELRWQDLSAMPGLSPGPYIQLEVTDSGHGMDPETLARAGEPFFTTKPPERGLGLGLASSREIVARHGGAMKLASEAGQGTRVSLFFPALILTDGTAQASVGPVDSGHSSHESQ